MNARDTLQRFDRYLAELGLTLEAVIIGGAALAMLDVITRPTKDCDVLAPELPIEIKAASRAFAAALRAEGTDLQDDWLNNGPASLAAQLPRGWRGRLVGIYTGAALTLHCLGRADLLKSKLWSLCDRVLDLGDCLALQPTAEELASALPWIERQDGNPDWPEHVRATLADLGRRLGHGV